MKCLNDVLVILCERYLPLKSLLIIYPGRNNICSSGSSVHRHGGKSARSRRYAAGDSDRFERGTHPYNIPSGPVSGASNSFNSSGQQFREESSLIDRLVQQYYFAFIL